MPTALALRRVTRLDAARLMREVQVTVDGQTYDLEIVDTAGQEEFASFRDTSLEYGDGFLLVFGLNSSSSFEELQQLRTKILRVKDTDSFPMVIIGNKQDLDERERQVPAETARAYAQSIQCPYMESSAKVRGEVHARRRHDRWR